MSSPLPPRRLWFPSQSSPSGSLSGMEIPIPQPPPFSGASRRGISPGPDDIFNKPLPPRPRKPSSVYSTRDDEMSEARMRKMQSGVRPPDLLLQPTTYKSNSSVVSAVSGRRPSPLRNQEGHTVSDPIVERRRARRENLANLGIHSTQLLNVPLRSNSPAYSKPEPQRLKDWNFQSRSADDLASTYESGLQTRSSVLPNHTFEPYSSYTYLPSSMSPRITDVVDHSLVPPPLRYRTVVEGSRPPSQFSSVSSSTTELLQSSIRDSLRAYARKALHLRRPAVAARRKKAVETVDSTVASDIAPSRPRRRSSAAGQRRGSIQQSISHVYSSLRKLSISSTAKATGNFPSGKKSRLPRELRSPAIPITPYQQMGTKAWEKSSKSHRNSRPKSATSNHALSSTTKDKDSLKHEQQSGNQALKPISVLKKIKIAFYNGTAQLESVGPRLAGHPRTAPKSDLSPQIASYVTNPISTAAQLLLLANLIIFIMGGERSTATIGTSSLPQLSAGPVGQQISSIYKERLGQFTGHGQYETQNLQAAMYEGRASGDEHLKISVYSPPNLTRPTFKEATSKQFKETRVGASFGPSWSTHWFKIQLRVPSNLLKKDRLELHWDADNEGLVWTEKGEPVQGLTGGGERVEWILPEHFRDGKFHTFYIEMACNRMFGNSPGGDVIQPPDPNKYYTLHLAEIVAVNQEARSLYYDFWIIGDAAKEFPWDSWESHKAMQICNAIMDAFVAGRGSQASIVKGREIARTYIGDVNSSKVYDKSIEHIVFAIGHCHIDTCWLWPWAETKRKIARSWASQCDLLDRYPEHRFTCSSAQQYKWLEQLYPPLFERVKAHVQKGTFQPVGGSWVEHDTNLPSGESLVRQFLYGQRYFESRFGARCKTFWLPDTFGYSSQIPQLSRLAGMNRFFTQKLSWNNINAFPHTTFRWVSLDGSQVLCHMTPSETYCSTAEFGDVKRSVSQHKSMDQDNTSLLVFGKGDGGGGPTFEHLEKLRRCRGISDTVGLLPRLKMGNSVEDFFDQLEKKAADGTQFVTWYGELYFELHRGTYTTQANNKRNNRRAEILLHDIEYLAALASVQHDSYKYPKKDIDDMWEGVLTCQFHDCLPGSCIEMCYDDSDELYGKIFDTGHKIMKQVLSVLGFPQQEPGNKRWAAVNTLPWQRAEIVKLPNERESQDPAYALVKGGPGILQAETLSDASDANQSVASIKEIRKGVFQLSNNQYKLEVERGNITSLVDLSIDREIIAKNGKANQLVIFDDKPLYWQAWDVEVFHMESRKELESGPSEIVEHGPHVVSLVSKTAISEHSWVKSTIRLAASIEGEPSYIEITSEVEWRETMKFLKVEFPVDIVNTEASYETQYGIIRRPTHYNTSWDMAKFEVCCHKWADLSEFGYGVSVLNDSKYGFATVGNLMRLSLLRAPKAPDAHADMGRHHIRYAIFPHVGPLNSRTVRAAYNFNQPFMLRPLPSSSSQLESSTSLLSSITLHGSPALILNAVKRGEDDEDVFRDELPVRNGRSIVVRVYESLGGKARGVLRCTLGVKKCWKTNALEDDEEQLKWQDGEVRLELRPFEVATYRLQL